MIDINLKWLKIWQCRANCNQGNKTYLSKTPWSVNCAFSSFLNQKKLKEKEFEKEEDGSFQPIGSPCKQTASPGIPECVHPGNP